MSCASRRWRGAPDALISTQAHAGRVVPQARREARPARGERDAALPRGARRGRRRAARVRFEAGADAALGAGLHGERAQPQLGGAPRFTDPKALGRAEHGEALFASKYCLVVEGYAPWTPRLSEAVGAGCVPAILSPALLPPFAGVLRWRDFAVLLRPADIGNLPAVLASHDHARLHANLLKVRRLLSFVATGPVNDDDALPLIVFEMWRRSRGGG